MISEVAVLEMQRAQHKHDKRNHADILNLHKNDRLKHYGLHFCKYVGRIARRDASKTVRRTLIDTLLVSLSAANTLHHKLKVPAIGGSIDADEYKFFIDYADAAGRFADACEKIDHQEEFVQMAQAANQDIFALSIVFAGSQAVDVTNDMVVRRAELSERQFFIVD